MRALAALIPYYLNALSSSTDISPVPRPFRSSVNKVNTKVDMRFEVAKASWIPDEVKDAMRQLVG